MRDFYDNKKLLIVNEDRLDDIFTIDLEIGKIRIYDNKERSMDYGKLIDSLLKFVNRSEILQPSVIPNVSIEMVEYIWGCMASGFFTGANDRISMDFDRYNMTIEKRDDMEDFITCEIRRDTCGVKVRYDELKEYNVIYRLKTISNRS
jgi:hypothetical protein